MLELSCYCSHLQELRIRRAELSSVRSKTLLCMEKKCNWRCRTIHFYGGSLLQGSFRNESHPKPKRVLQRDPLAGKNIMLTNNEDMYPCDKCECATIKKKKWYKNTLLTTGARTTIRSNKLYSPIRSSIPWTPWTAWPLQSIITCCRAKSKKWFVLTESSRPEIYKTINAHKIKVGIIDNNPSFWQ